MWNYESPTRLSISDFCATFSYLSILCRLPGTSRDLINDMLGKSLELFGMPKVDLYCQFFRATISSISNRYAESRFYGCYQLTP